MSKVVTGNQITGEAGEAIIKAEFLKIGLIYQCFGRLESGTDGVVELRDPKTGATSSPFRRKPRPKRAMRPRRTLHSIT